MTITFHIRAIAVALALGFLASDELYGGEPAEPSNADAPDSEPPAADPLRSPRAMLEVFGVDESHFRFFRFGQPISFDEDEMLLKLVYRVRRFDPADIARWMRRDLTSSRLAESPEEHQAEFIPISGRIREVEVKLPPREVVERYDNMDEYYICRATLDDGSPAIVATSLVPRAWPRGMPIDERFAADGFFLKTADERDGRPQLLFIAPRIAWRPERIDPAMEVNFGKVLLGDAGMDVGLLDDVQDRAAIGEKERETFYQMLWAAGKSTPSHLAGFARDNLEAMIGDWQSQRAAVSDRVKEMEAALKDFSGTPAQRERVEAALEKAKRQLIGLGHVIKKAEKKQFSVVPLFNDPERTRGEIVALEGTARRAVRIEVARPGVVEQPNADILARFGIDHYWEMEIFTDDSQDNPIVFCVRDLPEGFPTGERINEPVRIAGFFFKSWAYQSQRHEKSNLEGGPTRKKQLAPLLIGRGPIWLLPEEESRNPYAGLIAGGLFALALVAVWFWLWRYSKSDRAFHEKTLARRYAVEKGESLDDLGIESSDGPDFSNLE